ncbi:MAG: dethiobiotin synthase [Mariprofundales bacterium]|nr:dethiobiotin synthase [Mariprofundales bacterium]
MINRALFITANDTDAGKSYLTALLLRALQARGVAAAALKPVACGVEASCGTEEEAVNSDVALLQQLQPQQANINLYTNSRPLAPWCDQPIDSDHLLEWCQQRISQPGITLIEGVGGLMVPLASGFTQLDWIHAMPEVAIVLVVRARLGCLSQALSHLALLDHCARAKIWLVINVVNTVDFTYAEQCRQVVDAWHPWVKVELLMPNANAMPALMAWLCRGNAIAA